MQVLAVPANLTEFLCTELVSGGEISHRFLDKTPHNSALPHASSSVCGAALSSEMLWIFHSTTFCLSKAWLCCLMWSWPVPSQLHEITKQKHLRVNVIRRLWDGFWFILLLKCHCSQSHLAYRDAPGCVFPSWIHKFLFYLLIVLSITAVFQWGCCRFDTSLSLHILESFSATWSLRAWDWKLGLINLIKSLKGGNPVEYAVFTSFCMGRNLFYCSHFGQNQRLFNKAELWFFLHFIAMVCIFQLIQLYGLGTKAMRQIHVLAGKGEENAVSGVRKPHLLILNFLLYGKL